MKTRTGITLALVVTGLLAVQVWHGSAESALAFAGKSAPSRNPTPSAGAARAPWVSEAEAPGRALPPSLRDTAADGELALSGSGHLLPDVGLRRLFDYYLAATGEEARGTLRARIVSALSARLQEPARTEGVQWLDRYLAYREAARVMAPRMNESTRDRLLEIGSLRERFLGEGARTLFADEESLDARVARVDTTPAARDARLEAVEASLPPAQQAEHRAMMAPVSSMREEEALRERGGSEGDVRRLREESLGHDAATRLAALDEEHAAWKSRLDAFQTRDAAENGKLSGDARTVKRAALRDSMFSETERVRVQALERAGMLRPEP